MSGPSPFAAWWATYALATGIVSVGLDSAGHEVLSRIALVPACAAWPAAAAGLARRAPGGWRAETPAALTTVAAAAVLGTGFSAAGRHSLAGALLALALLLWAVLLTVEDRGRRGTVFLRCVATQGLAVLGATLAAAEAAAWLAHAALVLFWLGLALYGFALFRFQPRQVEEGRGDHWLAAGALAVSSLAGAKLLSADSARLYLWNEENTGALRTTTVTLLVLALIACVALLLAELFWPRHHYDVRRWATVFAAAVTAAAALAVADALDARWLDVAGQALLWIAVAAWLGCTAWALASARAGAGRPRVRSRARR
ncbi:membrane protein [Streptomyces variegatus]|uniref:Membrane protein n=1 Tax=Streptomyces variegatus TaxID=284040 RepID=A0A0M2GYW4_9ACTN|nr:MULTISPECIES: membrane protein [Streptomyces]KJK40905.1 membrane protein [Streptomyces variegatus]